MSPETYDLHQAPGADCCLILAHGAGSNRGSNLLVRVADAFASNGISVMRMDLPYRVKRPFGPPPRGSAEGDRAGIAEAIQMMRDRGYKRIYAGGHSYGGRQTTMLAAEQQGIADGLVLFAYPLRPPRPKGAEPRTAHFPALQTPALFFHGTRDPFGSPDDLSEALKLIPAPVRLVTSESDGHELGRIKADMVVREFTAFLVK